MRITCILFLIFPLIGFSQHSVTGSVITSDGKPIQGVSVRLASVAKPAESTMTDSSGKFRFGDLKPGIFQIQTGSLVYQDTLWTVNVKGDSWQIIIPPVILHPSERTLEGVTVTGKKPMLEFKEDHMVLTPASDPSIGSRPVTEILNHIPGILVDARNTITAKGQESVQLLVNGKIVRTAAGDYLSQLNTEEVEKIEVFENATRFSYLKSAIVINVILKSKQPKKLWNAALNTSTLPKFNPSADASVSVGKQRYYARLSHDQSQFKSTGYITRNTDTSSFYQHFSNKTKHQMTTVRFGFDRYIDSTTTLTSEISLLRHTDALQSKIGVEKSSGQLKTVIASSPLEKELNGFLTFRRDKKQKGHRMLEVGYTRFSLFNERDLPGSTLNEERRMNNGSVGIKGEWQQNLKKFRLMNGFFGQLTKIKDHLDTINVSSSLTNRFRNKMATTFHEVGWAKGKLGISLGAHIDFVDLSLERNGKKGFRYQRVFFNPTLKISRQKEKARTALSYGRKYLQPSTHMMFGQYSQYEYGRNMRGNYHLKPAIQDLVKLSWATTKKATVLIEASFDHTANPAVMLNQLVNGMITQTPENIKSRAAFSGLVSLSLSPFTDYSFTINIDGRSTKFTFYEKIYVMNANTWSGSATILNRFTINQKMALTLNAALHNCYSSLYRKVDPFVILSIQGSYKINPKINLSFSLNDLLNNSQIVYTGMIAQGYSETGHTANRMRNAFVSFRYHLINSAMEKKSSTIRTFLSE